MGSSNGNKYWALEEMLHTAFYYWGPTLRVLWYRDVDRCWKDTMEYGDKLRQKRLMECDGISSVSVVGQLYVLQWPLRSSSNFIFFSPLRLLYFHVLLRVWSDLSVLALPTSQFLIFSYIKSRPWLHLLPSSNKRSTERRMGLRILAENPLSSLKGLAIGNLEVRWQWVVSWFRLRYATGSLANHGCWCITTRGLAVILFERAVFQRVREWSIFQEAGCNSEILKRLAG